MFQIFRSELQKAASSHCSWYIQQAGIKWSEWMVWNMLGQAIWMIWTCLKMSKRISKSLLQSNDIYTGVILSLFPIFVKILAAEFWMSCNGTTFFSVNRDKVHYSNLNVKIQTEVSFSGKVWFSYHVFSQCICAIFKNFCFVPI